MSLRQVEINSDGLLSDRDAVADLFRCVIDNQMIEKFLGLTNFAECEFELHPHNHFGALGRLPGRQNLVL